MSSKSANWNGGTKIKNINNEHSLKRWVKLWAKPDISPEFKAQIERNIRQKGGKV